jgi:hypothetical protein
MIVHKVGKRVYLRLTWVWNDPSLTLFGSEPSLHGVNSCHFDPEIPRGLEVFPHEAVNVDLINDTLSLS